MQPNPAESEERSLFSIVVHVLVFNQDKSELLLLKRANTAIGDGHYSLPGGHLKPSDASVKSAVIREAKEETGLELQSVEPIATLPYEGGVNLVFESNLFEGEATNLEPRHCSELRWFALTNLPVPLVPWLEDVLRLSRSPGWYYDSRD